MRVSRLCGDASELTAGEGIPMAALQEAHGELWGASPDAQVLRVLWEAELQPLGDGSSSPGWSSSLFLICVCDLMRPLLTLFIIQSDLTK